jgi:hypothetical protein
MATLKTGFLPRIKKISDENDAVAYFDRRLLFPAVQEAFFVQMLRLERRRTERSGRPFMLVLIEGEHFRRESRGLIFHRVAAAISSCTRETDVLGWYKQDATLGLLMTEIACADNPTIDLLTEKISLAVQRAVGDETFARLKLVFRVFPQIASPDHHPNSAALLYPDLATQ